jgi:hypothetical protein
MGEVGSGSNVRDARQRSKSVLSVFHYRRSIGRAPPPHRTAEGPRGPRRVEKGGVMNAKGAAARWEMRDSAVSQCLRYYTTAKTPDEPRRRITLLEDRGDRGGFERGGVRWEKWAAAAM